jgi:hypothetical protein
MISQNAMRVLGGGVGWGGGVAADGGSGNAHERLSLELDKMPLGNHVWLHSPSSSGGGGAAAAARCAVVRRKVLRSLAGEAGLAAKVEGFGEYLDRRIRPGPQANQEALRWACVAVGLPSDALDCPLDEGAHAALNLFHLVTFQRLPPAHPPTAVLPTAKVTPPTQWHLPTHPHPLRTRAVQLIVLSSSCVMALHDGSVQGFRIFS